MKRTILIAAAILLLNVMVAGQILEKGSLIGLHKVEPVLASGITMDQYTAFLKDKLIPAYEKSYPGLKCYLMKSKRGECADCTILVFFFQSEEIRNKYFKQDGDYTSPGLEGKKKMESVLAEMEKMDKSKEVYTDYVIQ